MKTFYIGSSFKLVSELFKDGSPADFTGWSVLANIYDQNGSTLISPLLVTFLDITQGSLTLIANSTASWPAGKARIDMKFTTPTGDVILGAPYFFRIAQSPLSN